MTADELRTKLADLERQRARLAQALAQTEGAVAFCKGLVAEADSASGARSCAAAHPRLAGDAGGEG